MDQGFTRMAPLTEGEHPTNSDTTSIEFLASGSTSCSTGQPLVHYTNPIT